MAYGFRLLRLAPGSRRLDRDGRLSTDGTVLDDDPRIEPARLKADGEPLDPAPLTLILHKPVGFVCSTEDPGRLVYDLLPARFRRRDPVLSVAGRLDKDTSGLVLMTDDGQLLHKIISPKRKVEKLYQATSPARCAGMRPRSSPAAP